MSQPIDPRSHLAAGIRKRLREILAEARRLRRVVRAMTSASSVDFIAVLGEAEMLRVTLPSAHSMPRGVCPHCNQQRAMRRGCGVFYQHEPCGIVRAADGKRLTSRKGATIINIGEVPEHEWA